MTEHLKDIQCTAGDELSGTRIALGITGSIAAIEAPRLSRELMRHGADVYAVMSREAARLVTPTALEWCTGNPVVLSLSGRVEHIAQAGKSREAAHLILIAPATANTISKMALGIDDTPVTTLASTAIGSGTAMVVAPAMHEPMYRHPVVLAHLQKLEELGIAIVQPTVVEQKAKMAAVEQIVEAVIGRLGSKSLFGRHVLITAGPTVEFLDPVRTLTNRSSGRMGVALAREALRRGARVTFVYGPGSATPPAEARTLPVVTSHEMLEAVRWCLREDPPQVAIFAAAVADYEPVEPAAEKKSTASGEWTVRLRPTVKIVDQARDLAPGALIVAFKAETAESVEALQEAAQHRLASARADLMVANMASGFGAADNEVYILGKDGPRRHLPAAPKSAIARGIWTEIEAELTTQG